MKMFTPSHIISVLLMHTFNSLHLDIFIPLSPIPIFHKVPSTQYFREISDVCIYTVLKVIENLSILRCSGSVMFKFFPPI